MMTRATHAEAFDSTGITQAEGDMSDGHWSQAARTALLVVVFLIVAVIAVSVFIEIMVR